MELLFGIVIGLVAGLLIQRFLPVVWAKWTQKANKAIDEKIQK